MQVIFFDDVFDQATGKARVKQVIRFMFKNQSNCSCLLICLWRFRFATSQQFLNLSGIFSGQSEKLNEHLQYCYNSYRYNSIVVNFSQGVFNGDGDRYIG